MNRPEPSEIRDSQVEWQVRTSELEGLNEALETLGVPLFDQQAAALANGLIEGDSPVWLSDAVQKAVITEDEKGTTAAVGSAMPEPTKPFEMICDKPFAFILCDNTYDGGTQILFTGIVNQPV